ncbi:isopropylmalate isomerase [Pseudoblastomonas halimionae]|uniref:Isopropylmalate isomerase n=1 Tax=Alteriqipengyuania halimionae TaxID=1926630 RepID=A0A6I4U1U1_9SPHN|nr:isopropylmalate isomerase [Alteriqipengyuania halimionae]MXP08905.1 isopropylmalate isomerase [Alteriqipengyuania halimionae]
MTKKLTGKAAIGAAIGSAAIAAAMLYANKRKAKGNTPETPEVKRPTGPKPETD